MRTPKNKAGFTIVELLVVIVVIGILAAITIVAYNGVTTKAKVVSVKSDLANDFQQLSIDSLSNGTYPATAAAANNGQGLKSSPGTTLQYSYSSTTNSYCLSGTISGIVYYVTSSNNIPTVGSCPPLTPPVIASVGAATTTLASGSAGATVNYSPGVPSGVVSGSVVVLAVTVEWQQVSGSAVGGTSSSVTAAGFTQASFYSFATSDNWGAEGTYLFYKDATGADSGTYAVTVNTAANMKVYAAGAVAFRVTGANSTANPFSVFKTAAPAAQATSFMMPAFTPSSDNNLIIGVAQFSNNSSVTIPSGWTSLAYAQYLGSVADISQGVATSTGNLTWNVTINDYPAILVATIPPGN